MLQLVLVQDPKYLLHLSTHAWHGYCYSVRRTEMKCYAVHIDIVRYLFNCHIQGKREKQACQMSEIAQNTKNSVFGNTTTLLGCIKVLNTMDGFWNKGNYEKVALLLWPRHCEVHLHCLCIFCTSYRPLNISMEVTGKCFPQPTFAVEVKGKQPWLTLPSLSKLRVTSKYNRKHSRTAQHLISYLVVINRNI